MLYSLFLLVSAAKSNNKKMQRTRQSPLSSSNSTPRHSPQNSPSWKKHNIRPQNYGLQRQSTDSNIRGSNAVNENYGYGPKLNNSNFNPQQEGNRPPDYFGRDQPRNLVQPRYPSGPQGNDEMNMQTMEMPPRSPYRNPEPPFPGNNQIPQYGDRSPSPAFPGPAFSGNQSPFHPGGPPQSPYQAGPPPMPDGSPSGDRPPTPPMPPLPIQPPSPFHHGSQPSDSVNQMPDMSPKSFYGSYGPPSPFLPNRAPRPFMPQGTKSSRQHQEHHSRGPPQSGQHQGPNQWTEHHGGTHHRGPQHRGPQHGNAQHGGPPRHGNPHQQDPSVHGHFQQGPRHAQQRGSFEAGPHRQQSPGSVPWNDDPHKNSPHPPNWSPLSSSSGDLSNDFNAGFGQVAKDSPPPPPPPPMPSHMHQRQDQHNFHPQDPRIRPRHNILPPPMIPGPPYPHENFGPRGSTSPMNMNPNAIGQDPRVQPSYPSDPRMRPNGPYNT